MKNIQDIKNEFAIKYFGDTYNNVIVLFKTLEKAYREKLLNNSEELKKLMTVYAALNSNDITMLKTLKGLDPTELQSNLYDLYKKAQYACFDKIKQECYTFNEKDIDENLSQKDQIVYNINKRPENLLVNVAKLERDMELDKNQLDKFLNQYVLYREYRKIGNDFKSLSFVNNHDIHSFRDINQYVTFVYPNDIPENYLITISKKDAHVKFYDKNPASRMAQNFLSPENLLNSTNEFNEIAVIRKDIHNEESREIKPIAILCNKKITELERKIAKRLNISIIFSETEYVPKKYFKKKSLDYTYYNYKKRETKYDFEEIK